MENQLTLFDPEFNYEVPEIWDKDVNIHAMCDISRHAIIIKKSVYIGAYRGKGRDRLTIMHEVAHYLLFTFFGCPVFRSFKTAQKVPKESDPEWQAKNLAGLLMCPPESIAGLSVEQVMRKHGVSYSAAQKACKIRDFGKKRGYHHKKKK
jgi:Zn-dependent peptidase ImmA (M78 family)